MTAKKKTTLLSRKPTHPKKAATREKAQAKSSSLQEDEKHYIARPLRFIDLFCGIGGFRIAFEKAGGECVFSSDYEKHI
ncbi:DNA cytosine methyltransferase [Akkermansiaceae bacterium]|nr:DNA cytosine methyltransferase [Akkermansiaceae bacterium]